MPEEDVDFQALPSEEEDDQTSPPEYRISSTPADLTLDSYHARWKSGEILVPGFQRKFVWKLPQSSKLIESFLLGLPVPSVFLWREADERHSVIDGQQRLKSVFYFFEGFFGDEDKAERRTVFRLKGLNEKSRFSNKTYTELSEADQRRLRNSVLRAYIIDQIDPKDNTSIYHIFERLNTGGTQLKNQEVRNCVCWGALNSRILELNRVPDWRAVMGRPGTDRRMKDVELILRLFALHDDLKDYDRPMKDFLTTYMRQNRNPSSDFLTSKSDSFTAVCKSVIENLGQKPFHVWAGLNVAVLDSVMLAFLNHPGSVPTNIKARFQALVKERPYIDLVTGATADLNNVKSRIAMADKTLFS